ncbi:MAG: radical SAM protein [Myxococcales bacterium]|nr:radical SAM protein [Myxococcales bacterium]
MTSAHRIVSSLTGDGSLDIVRPLRRLLCAYLTARARTRGQRFRCEALSGSSNYNISINCDLTVSCNCQDYDGRGRLGSLREQTLEEVFSGPTAREFRQTLASGRLPLDVCARCPDLRVVARSDAERAVNHYSLPSKGLMLETSVDCNLNCISCARSTVVGLRGQRRMSLEDLERVSRFLGQLQVEQISFFNLGEPFLTSRVLEELRLIRAYNPTAFVDCSTNGIVLSGREKREAALLTDRLVFSIDGIDTPMTRKYQRGGDFEKAYRNMKDLIAYRNERRRSKPEIVWKYVLFRWNDRPAWVERAMGLASEAGVNSIMFWPTFSPPHAVSLRYHLHPFFRRIGRRERYGIVVSPAA